MLVKQSFLPNWIGLEFCVSHMRLDDVDVEWGETFIEPTKH